MSHNDINTSRVYFDLVETFYGDSEENQKMQKVFVRGRFRVRLRG